MVEKLPNSTEVFVIGGGPAGLAAAIAARMRGFDVMVADAAVPPIDKACGEGLMPDSRADLSALGVSLAGCTVGEFRGIRFTGDAGSVSADFPQGIGAGLRRVVLHTLLVDRAAQLGVRMLWGTRVLGITPDAVALDHGRVRSRWIVGADGLNSRVRGWAGLDAGGEHDLRVALRRHYRADWSEYVEIFWGRDQQAYVTTVGGGEICVAVIARKRPPSFEAALAGVPELSARLAGAEPTTPVRGGVTLSRRLRSVYRGNVALIGDASGSVDAITGEGLALGFRQAVALADALVKHDLPQYQAAHRNILKLPSFMSRTMLLMDKSGWLRGRALRAFARHPESFAGLLALHVGHAPGSAVGGLAQLGWQMLTS